MTGYLLLRIKQIVWETRDAATFVLENTNREQPVLYEAGQFLTLIFERQGKEIRRSYSLSSAPDIDENFRITVKQVENGEFSRHLLSSLKEGEVLKALHPAGRFTFPEFQSGPADVFFLAAGSGIVPVFSMLKTLLPARPDLRITLVYSNRSEKTTIFRDQINALAERYPAQFRVIHILSRPLEPAGGIIYGHLNNHLLEDLVEQYLNFEKSKALFFICGPFTYLRMARITLRAAGFREEQLHKENYVVKEAVPPHFTYPEGPWPKEVRLDRGIRSNGQSSGHDRGGKTDRLRVSEGQTVLDAALQAGIDLPYSCKAGVCATCTARCVSGEVKMSVNEVLTTSDLEQGLVLTCVAYPVTQKVHIEIEM